MKFATCSALLVLFLQTLIVEAAESTSVFPKTIELTGARDFQGFVVQSQTESGITRDLTTAASAKIVDSKIAKIEGTTVFPVANGKTELLVETIDGQYRVPIAVKNAELDDPLSFNLDVLPVLTKAGCNAGRCHGAARGKDGFRLSLYGFDPEGDHYRLTDEMVGRRINMAYPKESLLLKKGTGDVVHTGGQLFDEDSQSYRTLVRWIREGAKKDPIETTHPKSIEVFPKEVLFSDKDQKQKMVVVASYADGSSRDVTNLSVFLSNNDTSAAVDEQGVVTAGSRGEAFLMARFETFTKGIPAITLAGDQKFEFPEVEEFNEIDTLVHNKLKKLRIKPSEICTDEEFLRRVYIDLAGIMPDEATYQDFISSKETNKREKLVDKLLAGDDFVDLWAMKFGELLKIRTDNQVSYKALLGFHNWLRERISRSAPLNQIFQQVISAQGGTFDNPPTNYFQIEANKRLLAENVAQVFLGMRIQCAQCHNHPFDRWTMDDYYGFTAFFSQIDFKQSQDPREYIVYNSGQGEVYHLVDNRVVQPKFLGGAVPELKKRGRRQVLGDWIADGENPYFARNMANIIWGHHFGRGIIDPVDDVRVSNPPVNQQLLDFLESELKQNQYDLRALVRMICLSRTYQLSTQPNETNKNDLSNFSRAQIRRIRAEVLLDSISKITRTKDRFSRLPEDARSIEIADGAVTNYFLSTFGRASRETICSCEVEMEPTLSQAFHLLNGETTNDKIKDGAIVDNMLKAGSSPRDVIDHIYVSCYSRKPTESELTDLLEFVGEHKTANQPLNDILWAVLNSKEFVFNH